MPCLVAVFDTLLFGMSGTVQASSSVTVTVDADNAGSSGEVGRLQGHCYQY